MPTLPWTDTVLNFWFHILDPEDWFSDEPRVDAAIQKRFAALHARLTRDAPSSAALDAQGHLAAIIVLDQFSRNLHRASAKAFANDDNALDIAIDAVDRKLDAALTKVERQFLYMPFMHSEDRTMQSRSVALFTKLGNPEVLKFAKKHCRIIHRFGRFPHRNKALGRTSTDAEIEFMRNDPGFTPASLRSSSPRLPYARPRAASPGSGAART